MTWVVWLSLILIPLHLIDRAAYSFRRWWAPIYGLLLQALWIIYGVALGKEGLGMWIIAVLVGILYIYNIPRWYKHRKKSEV